MSNRCFNESFCLGCIDCDGYAGMHRSAERRRQDIEEWKQHKAAKKAKRTPKTRIKDADIQAKPKRRMF